jgi:hypothetical protein
VSEALGITTEAEHRGHLRERPACSSLTLRLALQAEQRQRMTPMDSLARGKLDSGSPDGYVRPVARPVEGPGEFLRTGGSDEDGVANETGRKGP